MNRLATALEDRRFDGRSTPPAATTPELTGALVFLFAVRWGAWVIALVAILVGDLHPESDRHEPLLLALTAAQSLAATLYVPVLRPRIRRALGLRPDLGSDLLVMGLVDIAMVLAVVYFSGGWRSPYYQYTLTVLVVPAFLLNLRESAVLVIAFTAAYLSILAVAGEGTESGWADESLAPIVISPLLVVAVVQYLSWLTRRLAEQREQARRALEENVRLQREREELVAQEERSRVAREIHDGIAQSIYMLSLNLEKAADVASDDATLGQRLKGLVSLAKETLLEVRHYIFDLKPLLTGDAGLTSTIQAQIREFSAVSGLPVELEVKGEERQVAISLGSCLYRIAQEALANVYRHADATAIDVRLAFHDDSVCLEIEDNGRGFAVDSAQPASSGGRGLRNMHQRASELGGRLEISSQPEKGTTVRVIVPLDK